MAAAFTRFSAPPRERGTLSPPVMSIIWLIALAKLLFHIYFNNRYTYFHDDFNFAYGDHRVCG